MSDEILTDNQGNPVYKSEVLSGWLDTVQAAHVMRVKSKSTVNKRCRAGHIRAVQVGNVWYVDPKAAREYRPGKHY